MMESHVELYRETLKSLFDSSVVNLSTVNPSTLDPSTSNPSTFDPMALASNELSECSLTEHNIAAGMIASDQEGLQALATVHLALRRWCGGYSECDFTQGQELREFHPMNEYVNVAVLGSHGKTALSQQKLMAAGDSIDIAGEYTWRNGYVHLPQHRGLFYAGMMNKGFYCLGQKALQVIKTVRWEWHVGVSSELPPSEKRLVKAIDSLLSCKHR